MSKKPESDNPLEADDFTLIKGIGSKTHDWLTLKLNIQTFKELAALSSDDLEAQLRNSGRAVSLLYIEEWRAQAEELAALKDSSSQHLGQSMPGEMNETTNAASATFEWKTLASFVVEFQNQVIDDKSVARRTTVHHMEEDKSESWQGIEEMELCKWMLDKLSDDSAISMRQDDVAENPAARKISPLTVEINDIRIIQPWFGNVPHSLSWEPHESIGFSKSNEPFSFEIAFKLSGSNAGNIRPSINKSTASIYLRNLSTFEKTSLQTTKATLSDASNSSYSAFLPQTGMLTGFYHLTFAVTVELDDKTAPLAAVTEMPLFQVS